MMRVPTSRLLVLVLSRILASGSLLRRIAKAPVMMGENYNYQFSSSLILIFLHSTVVAR